MERRPFYWNFHKTQYLQEVKNLVQWLRGERILPVIAHPERNEVFQKYPVKLKPFIDADCPLQVTAGSLFGGFGKSAHKLAINLLKEGKVKAISSDCHNLRYRPPTSVWALKPLPN
jgi:protein-tyrosine phosphatase